MEGRVPKPAELSLPSTVSKFESFLANTGAICLLTGSTGIGKSTLVMSICKDEKIDVIEYMGDEVRRASSKRWRRGPSSDGEKRSGEFKVVSY